MITIKELSEETKEDFFALFEGHFFEIDEHCACYCTCWNMSKDDIQQTIEDSVAGGRMSLREVTRTVAECLIDEGLLNGYLAYVDDQAVAWCNSNDRERYKNEILPGTSGKIKSITCFKVSPEYRHKRIASTMLRHVCDEAALQGYACVEAYPMRDHFFCEEEYLYSLRMYEKAGFEKVYLYENSFILRKNLDSTDVTIPSSSE